MASICHYSFSLPPIPKSPNSNTTRPFSTCISLSNLNPFLSSIHTFRSSKTRANDSLSSTTLQQQEEEESMSIENLLSFFDLNLGKWKGSFFVSIQPFTAYLLLTFFFPELSCLVAEKMKRKGILGLQFYVMFDSKCGVLLRLIMLCFNFFYCQAKQRETKKQKEKKVSFVCFLGYLLIKD